MTVSVTDVTQDLFIDYKFGGKSHRRGKKRLTKAVQESTKRYSDAINLEKKKKEMAKVLLVATCHLPDVTSINSLPKEMRVGRPSRNGQN